MAGAPAPVGISVACVLGALLLYAAAKAWWAVWRRPRSIEEELRRQGVPGTTYKILFGDLRDDAKAMAAAWSKPIPLGHRITPRVHPSAHQLLQEHGKMVFMWAGTIPRLLVKDPELAKEIFAEKGGHIQKPPANPLVEILATGVAAFEGEKWARRRKLIMPAFHVDKLKGMVPAFLASCEQLVKRWEEQVGAEGSCELDVWPEFQSLTGDVISRTAFGSCYEEGKRIFELQKEQVLLVLDAVRGVYIPGFRFVPTPKNRRRQYLDREIKSILRGIIRRKEEGIEQGGSVAGEDLLGLLLQASRDGADRETKMSVEDVMEECKLFYFAGQETTSVLLTWTMVVLSMHQDWQHKARAEVLQVCGRRNPPDIQNMNQLRIVNMVLNEVLRLYPPVIFLFRHAHRRVKLAGTSIPAGVDLVVPTIFIHHDPEIWGEDAEEFNPERFSQGISKAAGKEQNAFFPFGWGPRICLGQNFAMVEAKAVFGTAVEKPIFAKNGFSLMCRAEDAFAPFRSTDVMMPCRICHYSAKGVRKKEKKYFHILKKACASHIPMARRLILVACALKSAKAAPHPLFAREERERGLSLSLSKGQNRQCTEAEAQPVYL